MVFWVIVFAFKDFVKVLWFDDPVEVGSPAAVVVSGEESGLTGQAEDFEDLLLAFGFEELPQGFFAVFVHALDLRHGRTKSGEGGFNFFEIKIFWFFWLLLFFILYILFILILLIILVCGYLLVIRWLLVGYLLVIGWLFTLIRIIATDGYYGCLVGCFSLDH